MGFIRNPVLLTEKRKQARETEKKFSLVVDQKSMQNFESSRKRKPYLYAFISFLQKCMALSSSNISIFSLFENELSNFIICNTYSVLSIVRIIAVDENYLILIRVWS